MYTGPALVANGRDADFAEFVKSRKLSGYDLAGMQMAGDLMAGKADKALAVLAPFTGDDRTNAVTRTLEMLLLARRMDASGPMLAHLDLATPDGVAACAENRGGNQGQGDRRTMRRRAGRPSPKGEGGLLRRWNGRSGSRRRARRGRRLGPGPQSRFARNRGTIRRRRSSNLSNMPIRPSCFRSARKVVFVRVGRERRVSRQDAGSRRTTGGRSVLRLEGGG